MKYTIITLLIILSLSSKGQVIFTPEIGVQKNIKTAPYVDLRFGYQRKNILVEFDMRVPPIDGFNPLYVGADIGYQVFFNSDKAEDLYDKNDYRWSVTPLLIAYWRTLTMDEKTGVTGHYIAPGPGLRIGYKCFFLQAAYVDKTPMAGTGMKVIL